MIKNGDYIQADFFDNVGGLNLADSPFKVGDGQATGGVNYSYALAGGIRKREGHALVNSSPDTALKSLGIALYNTASGSKTVMRAADLVLQSCDLSVPSFTTLTEDTLAAGSSVLASGTSQPVVWSQFNTASTNVLWAAGGGLSTVYGAYGSSKITQNGSALPTGSITPTVTTPGTGTFTTSGKYFWGIALRKKSTQAVSNVVLDVTATLANATDIVTFATASLGAIDTTKYDAIVLYRSAVAGVTGFTTGDLVKNVDITAGVPATFTDTGSTVSSTVNVPRSASLILDNATLPSGTYNTLTTFKRRLVTATGSTIYFSDINKPESWPVANTITVPSGGPITALSIISFTSVGSNTIDEILVIFKERELWVVTGSSITDYSLKFIDSVGCPAQPLIVIANGYLAWVDASGVYLWDGTGKPIKCSRPINPIFDRDGDLDTLNLNLGHGAYFRKKEQIIWFLSHKIYGVQKYQLKLDLRLTLPSIQTTLNGRSIDGVFIFDSTTFALYSSCSMITPSDTQETLLIGDSSGYVYKAFTAFADAGGDYSFKYATKFLDGGNPNQDKRFMYVVVWVEEAGTWNLSLDWWTDYASADGSKSTRALPISTKTADSASLWDLAQWDVASWDDYTAKLKPLVFQLSSDAQNNSDGKCIRLQFREETANNPVTIAGFSVLFSTKGLTK